MTGRAVPLRNSVSSRSPVLLSVRPEAELAARAASRPGAQHRLQGRPQPRPCPVSTLLAKLWVYSLIARIHCTQLELH